MRAHSIFFLVFGLACACGGGNGGASGGGACGGAQLAGTATLSSGGGVGCQASFTFDSGTFNGGGGNVSCTTMSGGSGGLCNWTIACGEIDISLVGSGGSLSGTWTESIPQDEGFPPETCTWTVTGFYQ